MMENKAKSCLRRVREPTLEVGVRLDYLWNFADHSGKILLSVKYQYRTFGIPPRRITKQLINLFLQGFRSVPKHTLCYKNIFPINADQDVGLPLKIEGFTCRMPLILPVKLNQKVLP